MMETGGTGQFEQRLGELRSRKQEVSFLLEVASRRGQMRRCTAKEMDQISNRVFQRSRERFELEWKRARERNRELLSAIREALTVVDQALGPTEASRELKLAELDVYLQAASLEPSYLDSMASRLEHLEAEKQAVVKVAKEREAAALRNLQVEARLSAKMVSLADTKRQSAERLAELEARRAANAKRDAQLVQMLKQQTADAERLKAAAARELSRSPHDAVQMVGARDGWDNREVDEVLGANEHRSGDEKELYDATPQTDDVAPADQGDDSRIKESQMKDDMGGGGGGEDQAASVEADQKEEKETQLKEQREMERDQKAANTAAYETEREMAGAVAAASAAAAKISESDDDDDDDDDDDEEEEDSIDDALGNTATSLVLGTTGRRGKLKLDFTKFSGSSAFSSPHGGDDSDEFDD